MISESHQNHVAQSATGADSPPLLASSATNVSNISLPDGRILPSSSNISLLSLANNNTTANCDPLLSSPPLVEYSYGAAPNGGSSASPLNISNSLAFLHNQNDIINQKRSMHYNSDIASTASPGVSAVGGFTASSKPRVSKLSAQLKKSSSNNTAPLPTESTKHFPSITSPISSSFMNNDDFPSAANKTACTAFASSPLLTKSRPVNTVTGNGQFSYNSSNTGLVNRNRGINTPIASNTATTANVGSYMNSGSSSINANRGIRIASQPSTYNNNGINGSGSESPILGPVQTPGSEICMTPLTLNDGRKF